MSVKQLLTNGVEEDRMNDPKDISLTDVEWRVMRSLWALGHPTLGEMLRDLQDTGWSKQSLISFLKRLEGKGLVQRDTGVRPSRYSALLKQEEALRGETHAVLHTVFGGDPLLMVTNAVSAARLTDEDIQSLIDLLTKGGETQ